MSAQGHASHPFRLSLGHDIPGRPNGGLFHAVPPIALGLV